MTQALVDRPMTVTDLKSVVTTPRRVPAEPSAAAQQLQLAPRSAVLVLGAHPGAGASTVAAAVADAASASDAEEAPVHLLDAGAPDASGLGYASDTELGVDAAGWRLGRRGNVEMRRVATAVSGPSDVPQLPPLVSGRVIVDAGWPIRDVLASEGWLGSLVGTAELVLVCRATVPGVRRAESALGQLPGQPSVVVVGVRRWPGSVRASFGPQLRAARDSGRVEAIPADQRLAIEGVDPSPMPRAVASAAAQLVSALRPRSSRPTPSS